MSATGAELIVDLHQSAYRGGAYYQFLEVAFEGLLEVFRLLAAIACLLLVTACVPMWFPTSNPTPYSEGEFAGFDVGSTSDEVVEVLGQPQLNLRQGNLWIYGRTRAASTDLVGDYLHDYRAVLIEFSDGIVAYKDILQGDHVYAQGGVQSCWSASSGLCLVPVWDSRSDARDEPKTLSRKYSAVISRGEDDVQAKRFLSEQADCAVYVYLDAMFSAQPYSVTVGSVRDEPVPLYGYLYVRSVPGTLELKAGRNVENIDCQAGSLHFYTIGHHLFTDADDIRIESVDSDEAEDVIRKRYLLVTW